MTQRPFVLGGTLLCLVGLVLEACGSSAPRSDSSRTSAPQAANVATTYGTVAGTWLGRGFQMDIREHWELRMHVVGEVAEGGTVGEIDYPGLHCKSRLTRMPEMHDHLVVLETLTEGQETCVDGGTIRMRLDRSGQGLEWHYFFPNGEFGAEAVLARESH